MATCIWYYCNKQPFFWGTFEPPLLWKPEGLESPNQSKPFFMVTIIVCVYRQKTTHLNHNTTAHLRCPEVSFPGRLRSLFKQGFVEYNIVIHVYIKKKLHCKKNLHLTYAFSLFDFYCILIISCLMNTLFVHQVIFIKLHTVTFIVSSTSIPQNTA